MHVQQMSFLICKISLKKDIWKCQRIFTMRSYSLSQVPPYHTTDKTNHLDKEENQEQNLAALLELTLAMN